MSENTEKNIVIDSIMSESDLESQSLNESSMPVSYTHLDVYKRQFLYLIKSNYMNYISQLIK